jgi:hypothetical protein
MKRILILLCLSLVGCYVEVPAPQEVPHPQTPVATAKKQQGLDFNGWDKDACAKLFREQAQAKKDWTFHFFGDGGHYLPIELAVDANNEVVLQKITTHPVADVYWVRELVGEKFQWYSGCSFTVESNLNAFYGSMKRKDEKTNDVILNGQWKQNLVRMYAP